MADDTKQAKAETTMVKGSLPANHPDMMSQIIVEKRQPKENANYRVRTRGVEKFRRCGIMFGPDETLVDGSTLTLEQKVSLLNTPQLTVDEIGGSAKSASKDEKSASK